MAEHDAPAQGESTPAPPELERDLFPKDRRLRLVRIDTDDYQGWYLREVPGEEPLLFLDHGRRPLLYDTLEQAVEYLRQRRLSIHIEGEK